MVQMKYPVFIQALAATVVILLIGMYLGIVLEQGRAEEINNYYVESEVMLIDILSLENLIKSEKTSCDKLEETNRNLLDKVYAESLILGEYEESGRITNALEPLHKKYDSLRTHLWINAIQIKEKCGEKSNTLVYLYNHSEDNLNKKAEQNVWSKVLYEIKQDYGSEIVLIPIAVDTNLETLSALISPYEIESLPVVIVNEDYVFRELVSKPKIILKLNLN